VCVRLQIPGTARTPFAEHAQLPARSFDSDLGFPTNFRDNYSLVEEIGSGSFGTVYAAEDIESGEMVAVKVRIGNLLSFPHLCFIADRCCVSVQEKAFV